MPIRVNAFKATEDLQRECELSRAIQSMPQDWAEIANGPFGARCRDCDGPYATLNRQLTAYENEDLNYVQLCPLCQADNDARWEEMWQEYWNSR